MPSVLNYTLKLSQNEVLNDSSVRFIHLEIMLTNVPLIDTALILNKSVNCSLPMYSICFLPEYSLLQCSIKVVTQLVTVGFGLGTIVAFEEVISDLKRNQQRVVVILVVIVEGHETAFFPLS